MSDISGWSTTAGSNNAASPNGFPEAMAAAGVNDSAREVMAQVKTFWDETPWRRVTAQSTTLTHAASDHGTLFSCTSTFTATLVALATAGTDHWVAFENAGSGVITIDGNAAETVLGQTTLVLNPGESCILTYGSTTNWAGHFMPAYHAPVTNYSPGRVQFIENTRGKHATEIDVSTALTVATWESIGPTGSGADNIWTGLDDVPTAANYIIVDIFISALGSTNGDFYSTTLYTRNNGDASAADTDTRTAFAAFYNRSGSLEANYNNVQKIIPVDSSNIFDAHWASQGTSTAEAIEFRLVGWGI